jgi:Domain of unknown function (DUF4349)
MTSLPRIGRRRPLLVAVTVLVGVLAVACASGAPAEIRSAQPAAQSAARAVAQQPAAPPLAQQANSGQGASDQAAPAQAGSTQPGPLALDRMVIRTAKLSVQVADVDQALEKARQVAQAGGGFVSGSNTRLEQDRTVADLTLQVRADALDTTLQALRGLGKVDSETSSSQDVTEEYVDLDANLRNLQASESAILRLMDRAQRIEDIISLQRELTNVRGQIERIQGRKTYLERRTDMATVSVSLHLPPADNASGPGGFDALAVARRGWNASLVVLRGVAELAIVVAAFSWWLVPFLGVAAYFFFIRRRPRPADA